MKKTILCISLLTASSFGFAQTGYDLTAGGLTTLGSGTTASSSVCPMIASGQTARIQLSADVVGSQACTASNAGVGTAHPKGKGYAYTASSNGGKISSPTSGAGSGASEFATTAAAQAAAKTAAESGAS